MITITISTKSVVGEAAEFRTVRLYSSGFKVPQYRRRDQGAGL